MFAELYVAREKEPASRKKATSSSAIDSVASDELQLQSLPGVEETNNMVDQRSGQIADESLQSSKGDGEIAEESLRSDPCVASNRETLSQEDEYPTQEDEYPTKFLLEHSLIVNAFVDPLPLAQRAARSD